MSKLIRSRAEWRKKAVERAGQVRELKKARRRHQNTIAGVKAQLSEGEKPIKKTENTPSH